MGTDRESTYRLILDGDGSALRAVMASFKSQFKSDVADIEATTNRVQIFQTLQTQVDSAAAKVKAATDRVNDLTASIASIKAASGNGVTGLEKDLAAAQKQLVSATSASDKQQASLAKLDAQLKSAGVDTSNLAAAQVKLAASLAAAQTAAALSANKNLLGLTTAGDVAPRIAALQVAFASLTASGKLSASELAAAEGLLAEKLAAVRGEISTTGGAFAGLSTQGSLALAALAARVIGPLAAIGAVTAGLRDSTKAALEYQQSVTQLGAASNASTSELQELTQGAAELARRLGFDVVQGLTAVRTIIASGIPKENALTVLDAAAELAEASFTDLGTSVTLTTTLINAFKIPAQDVGAALDKILVAARNGGPSVAELGSSIGELAPIATAAGLSLDQVLAALVVLKQRAQLDGPSAIAALNKAIATLSDPTPELAAKLKDLGVQARDAFGIIQEIGQKQLSFDVLKSVIPDARQIKAISALAENFGDLDVNLTKTAAAGGAAKRTNDGLAQTPQKEIDRFSESMHQLGINFGGAVVGGTGFLPLLSDLANKFDGLDPSVRTARTEFVLLGGAAAVMPGSLGVLVSEMDAVSGGFTKGATTAKLARSAFDDVRSGATTAAAGLKAALTDLLAGLDGQIAAQDKAIADQRRNLQASVTDLQGVITAIQTQAAASIASINSEAAAQTAALDKLRGSELDNENARTAIQKQASDARIAIITQSTQQILQAVNDEAAARLKIAQTSGKDTTAIEQATTQALLKENATRLQSLLSEAEKERDGLINARTQADNALRSIEQQRIEFNQSVEDKIRAIRASGLSVFDQYYDKVSQIDEDISKGRQALANGDADIAKNYAQKAIDLAGQIGGKVKEGDVEVVTSLQAQQTQITELTKGQGLYNDAVDKQDQAYKDAATAAQQNLNKILPTINDLKSKVDAINAAAEKGIQLKLADDGRDIAKAISQIDQSIEGRARLLQIKIDVQAILGQVDTLVSDVQAGAVTGAQQAVEQIRGSLNKVAGEHPQLSMDVQPALDQVTSVGKVVDKLADLKPQTPLTVTTPNLAAVNTELDNLEQPLSTTLTVKVKVDAYGANAEQYVGDVTRGGLAASPYGPNAQEFLTGPADGGGDSVFARGGPVPSFSERMHRPSSLQRYAAGGAVFRGPKVPGIGSDDTYPALLQAGSFVVKKSASQHYGDDLMMHLAQQLAAGGPATSTTTPESLGGFPEISFASAIGAPTLPTDFKALVQAVFAYIAAVKGAIILDKPGTWDLAIGQLNDDVERFNHSQSPSDLDVILNDARDIGLNIGYSIGAHAGFDVDGRRYHAVQARPFGSLPHSIGGVGEIGNYFDYEFYARGGPASDTVPAMLAPGEFVFQKSTVDRLGADFLYGLNNMQVPKLNLGALLAPPPRIQHFADGGLVGDMQVRGSSATPSADKPISINIVSGTREDRNWIVRNVVPVLEDLQRKSR